MAYFRATTGSGGGGETQIKRGEFNIASNGWGFIGIGFKPKFFTARFNGTQNTIEYYVDEGKVYQVTTNGREDVTSTWLNTYIYATDTGIYFYRQNAYYAWLRYVAVK